MLLAAEANCHHSDCCARDHVEDIGGFSTTVVHSLRQCSDACLVGWKYYGLNRGEHEGKTGIWYREWAPGARVSRQVLHSL